MGTLIAVVCQICLLFKCSTATITWSLWHLPYSILQHHDQVSRLIFLFESGFVNAGIPAGGCENYLVHPV
jgi:hypothetical protein